MRAPAESSNGESSEMPSIAVVGAGYVGLASAAVLSTWGHRVRLCERDEEKAALIRAGECPIAEPRLPELLRSQLAGGRLTVSVEVDVAGAQVVFICVGTPPEEDGTPYLGDFFDAVQAVGRTMRPGTTVVVKSTVPVGTCDNVEELLARHAPRDSFSVVSNPEFLRQGSVIDDTECPDRIVIGAQHEAEAEVLAAIYKRTGAPIHLSDRRTAELCKYAANAFLATRLSFMNEVAHVADHVGADVTQVAESMGMDHRIGRHFLNAGIGYGGSCLPKDMSAFRHFAKEANCATPLLDAVAEVNHEQPRRFAATIEQVLGGLEGKIVALLGVSFKPQTSDVRGSVSLELLRILHEGGAGVRVFDPAAMGEAAAELGPAASFAADPYDACLGADGVVIATEWPEFARLDWARIRGIVRTGHVFDGRNLLDPAAIRSLGFTYDGVGRNGQGMTASPGLVMDPTGWSPEHPPASPERRRPPRFMLYSHDGMGLGHSRRNLVLASALLSHDPAASVMVATGVQDIRLLGVPHGVEVLKLPSLRKVANGEYAARRLGVPPDQILALRSELLATAVRSFAPDVMIVDQHPMGAAGELHAALRALRENGGHAVLGLRDILDRPEVVAHEWGEQAQAAQIVASYSRVLVYGQQDLFDPIEEYHFPDRLADLVRFCGYVTGERDDATSGHVAGKRPTVLATAGSGEDGHGLIGTFLDAARGAPWRGVAVAGPLSPEDGLGSLRRRAEKNGVEFLTQASELGEWFGRMDAVVCMGGYNTLVEAVSRGTPTVCLPRTEPRQEQLMRARAFAERGLVRLLEPDQVSRKSLRREVSAALAVPRAKLSKRASAVLDFDGARRAAQHAFSLLDEQGSEALPGRFANAAR